VSRNDLTAFFERLQTDVALQEKARAVSDAADREEAFCRLASDEGFTFTVEELRAEQQARPQARLDDETLKGVAAGSCTIGGLYNPQPSEPMG
jgi:predicted ribosomally synthesized peptide with nif11-like leader